MAFLIIAGITIRVSPVSASEQAPDEVGSDSRAFAGGLRTTSRVTKRNFSFVSATMLLADYETLYAAINPGKQVACSGDAIPATNYRVKLTRTYVKLRGVTRSVATIALKQV